jgi:hypothetical protein
MYNFNYSSVNQVKGTEDFQSYQLLFMYWTDIETGEQIVLNKGKFSTIIVVLHFHRFSPIIDGGS